MAMDHVSVELTVMEWLIVLMAVMNTAVEQNGMLITVSVLVNILSTDCMHASSSIGQNHLA